MDRKPDREDKFSCPTCLLELSIVKQHMVENLDGGAPAEISELQCPICDERYTRYLILRVERHDGKLVSSYQERWSGAPPRDT